MKRKRITPKPLFSTRVKSWADGQIQVQTNVSASEKIRQKLEAMFSPRVIAA